MSAEEEGITGAEASEKVNIEKGPVIFQNSTPNLPNATYLTDSNSSNIYKKYPRIDESSLSNDTVGPSQNVQKPKKAYVESDDGGKTYTDLACATHRTCEACVSDPDCGFCRSYLGEIRHHPLKIRAYHQTMMVHKIKRRTPSVLWDTILVQ